MKKIIVSIIAVFILPLIGVLAAQDVPAENLIGKDFMQQWRELPTEQQQKNIVLKDNQIPVALNIMVGNENQESTKKPVFERDEQQLYQEKPSIKISSEDLKNITFLRLWDIPVDPNTEYVFRIALRGENIQGGTPFLGLATGDKNGGLWTDRRQFVSKYGPVGTYDWQILELPIKTRGTDTMAMLDIQLRNGTGTLWIGNVELIEK